MRKYGPVSISIFFQNSKNFHHDFLVMCVLCLLRQSSDCRNNHSRGINGKSVLNKNEIKARFKTRLSSLKHIEIN